VKILVISKMFPCKRHPTSAIFFANLMKEFAPIVDELIVVTPRVYIPKFLIKIRKDLYKWFLDPMVSQINGIQIIRPFVLSLPGKFFAGINGLFMQYCLHTLVKNLVKTRKIKIILGYNMIPEGIAAVLLAKIFKLSVGFWVIGTDFNDVASNNLPNYYLSKRCLLKSNLVVTESKDLEEKIKKMYTKSVKVRTFYKGIDISNFRNLPSKNFLLKKLELNVNRKYIIFVGRLIRSKGIYEVAQAFIRLAKNNPDFRLILVGEEIEKERLEKIFKEAKILHKIIFKGIISYQEVARFMKISDLLVFPSWKEGLPNVILESMAIGLPVVASNAGGIPEVIKNEITGLLVPVKNVDMLVIAVNKMMEDKQLRRMCINNAKELVNKKFDVRKNVNDLKIYLNKLNSTTC